MNAIDVFAAARPDVEVDEETLAAIAADVFDGVPRRNGGSARWRVLAVAAAVVALVAGLAVVVGRPDAPAPVDTVPPVIPADGEPLRMLPSDVDGLELTGFLSGHTPSGLNETVLVRPIGDGSYGDKVVVRRGPRDQLWFDVGNVAAQGEIVTSPLNTRGRAWDVVSAGSNTVFAQTDMDDGTALQASVDLTSDLDRARDAVVAVAASLSGAVEQPAQGVAFDPLPTGFEVVADVGPFDPWARFATVERAGASNVQVITYASDDPDLAFRLMAEDLRPVTVRGIDGFASTVLRAQKVIWQEAPGQWVVVQSDAGPTTSDELIAFAETLRVVTAAEWDAVVALPPGWEPGYPATTAPAPALPDDGGPLRMLPSDRSMYEFDAQLLERGLPGSGDYVAIARPDGRGGYVAPVWITRNARDVIWVSEPDWEGEGTFSEFELGGRTMEFVSDESAGGRIVQFDVGDGTVVVITAAGSAGMTRDELGRIALALDLDGAALGLETPPDGYEVVATGRLGEVPEPLRTMNVWRDGEQFAGLSVTVTSNPGFPFLQMGDAIEPVTIRGRSGWVTTSVWQTDAGPWERSALRWEEQPGQWVNLEEMNPVPLDELTAFAESLRVVTAEEWDLALRAPEEVVPELSIVPATTAPPRPSAPPGRLLVANASQVSGLAGQYSAALAGSGADVLDPVNASNNGGATARTLIFARPDSYDLADWVRDEVGVELINPFDSLDRWSFEIEGDLDQVDVLVVLGLDKTPADIASGRPIVFGDSAVFGAAEVLQRRNYMVNVEPIRPLDGLLVDVVTVVTALDPDVLVLHVANSGPIDRKELESVLEWTTEVPNVTLVNTHVDRQWADSNNTLLAEIDEPGDNLILMDWDALADLCPGDCFAEGGIQLTAVGAAYFAEKLSEITGF